MGPLHVCYNSPHTNAVTKRISSITALCYGGYGHGLSPLSLTVLGLTMRQPFRQGDQIRLLRLYVTRHDAGLLIPATAHHVTSEKSAPSPFQALSLYLPAGYIGTCCACPFTQPAPSGTITLNGANLSFYGS